MSDILNVFGIEYTGVNGIRAYDPSGVLKTYIRPSGSQAITQNNTYDVSALAQVVVNVESSGGTYQDKTGINPSTSSQTIVPDDGYDALSSVQINAMPSGSAATPATTITANPTISVNSTTGVITASVTGSKTIIPTVSAGYVSSGTSGVVSVSGSNTSNLSVQAAKTVTPTETEQTAVAAGKYTTGDIKVAAISSTYIGSGITSRSSTDLAVSGATVTVPAGYYSAQASKSVAAASHADPTVSVNTTTGLITASHTQAAGYVAAGTTTDTEQLATQAAATITPTEEEQTAVAANKYTLGAVKVAAIPDTYVGSAITVDPAPTVSGATVNIPSGYYSEATSKSVATTTHPDPSVSVNATTGLVTATHTQTAGYVSAGSTTGTTQLSVQAGATITPTETEQTAVAAGKYTTGAVKVAAISSTYVGSDITTRDETDLTASGATVTVPAGYYEEDVSKSVSSGSAATPATSVTANPTISVSSSGLITATASATKSVTPTVSAGYVSSGTAGTITVSGSNTSQLPTQAAVTATPSEEEQTIVAAGKYTTGAIKVAAIDSEYVGSDVPHMSSTDLTASGATVSVPAGYYEEAASKSVASGSATTPATTITANPTITVSDAGLITATASGSKSVTPTVSAGYVSTGTAGTVSVSGSNTKQLTTQAAKTVTPTEDEQTAVAAGVYTTGAVKVAAVPDDYVGSSITVDPTPTVSGATVSIPEGYYSEATSKSVSTTTHPAPTVSVNTTTGLITATHAQTAGYVPAGTTTGTEQLSVQAAKTVTPTETEQTAVAAGKYTTGAIKVAAISSTYIGSDIASRDETDLSVSGAIVTVPAGYYSEATSKSVATTTHPKPTVSVNTTNGLITATHAQTTGYVSAGTTTETSQLSVQAGTTITPTETEQTAVAAGKYTTGDVKVAAISSTYVGSDIASRDEEDLSVSGAVVTVPAGYYSESASKSVSSVTHPTPNITFTGGLITAEHTQTTGYVTGGTTSSTLRLNTQAAKTVTPTESVQTAVQGGRYLTGSIKVDAISSTYVGSGVARRSSTDLTASGDTVTAPSGYYSEDATISIDGATHADPSVSVNTTTGLITATHTQAAGYVTEGTTTATEQLSVQAGKTVTPTESEQTAVAAGKYTTGAIKIAAISSTYVGSGITSRSSTDLTASGATVTVPAGYYFEQASKSVSTMTLPTSASSSATSGYASKATIGRSTSNQYINIPAGYNSAGGYYTISAVPNGTATAPASISGTAASISTGTNTITLTKTVSVTPNVSTAGYISAGTAGNSSVSLTASVTTKAAATITPTKSTQTIASGTYLTGAQTIAAIPAAYQDVTGVTAAAGDVVSGKTIVSSTGATVNGSLVIQHYYTGSTAPSSSLGANGDIYLQA